MFRKMFLKFLQVIMKGAIRLRYRIVVRGKEVLKDPRYKKHGVLICPNHVAEIEPFILMSMLAAKMEARPLVTEKYYYYPFAKFFMNLVRAKPVAQFDQAVSEEKFKGAEQLFKEVVEDLKKGDRFLLYPSAALKTTPEERIGGRSLAHATVSAAPDTEILLVRITGLWGSRFSKAYSEDAPDFWSLIRKSITILLKNGIFFAPRRKVIIEFSHLPKNFPKYGTKVEFNRALEDFYNQYPDLTNSVVRHKGEPLQQVPYYFYSKKVPQVYIRKKRLNGFQDLAVPKHVRQDIMYQLSELSGKSVKEIDDNADLVHDLGLDSLNIATLFAYLETHYSIDSKLESGDIVTVQDLFAAAINVKESKKEQMKEEVSSWSKQKKKRNETQFAEGETIIEVFLNSCDRMGSVPACADAVSGELDYLTMRRAVVILARKIEKLEGDFIGVMLPSSVGAYIVILAIMLAGKTPVPLNWTIGSYFINHAIDLLGVKHVISSERFLQRLNNVDIGKASNLLVRIEDMRKSLTWKDKIRGALLAKKKAAKILSSFPAVDKKEEDIAIALFTSGTTALPKCVPLTHKNILTNQKSFIGAIDLSATDVLFMVLPAFHIFGLNVGLLPLLIGTRIYYSPDPLDASTISKEILKWHVTIILMAPTFYANLFRVATVSQLSPIRIFVSGAEAAPQSLVEFIQKLGNVWFIEGYGLTETSPVLAVNYIYTRARGVGKIIPCIDLVVIEPESKQKLAERQVGEICVRGDSVFSGYYKQDNKDVFIEIDGKKYYRTGDLGYYDEQGYLFLEGRLKLSFKKGGEMISLAAIETAIFKKAKERGWIPEDINHMPFACVPREMAQGGTPKIVLFSEISLPLDQVNSALLESGFSRLYKVNEVNVIDQIPILKTGKTCYRKLFEIVGKK